MQADVSVDNMSRERKRLGLRKSRFNLSGNNVQTLVNNVSHVLHQETKGIIKQEFIRWKITYTIESLNKVRN